MRMSLLRLKERVPGSHWVSATKPSRHQTGAQVSMAIFWLFEKKDG